MGNIEQVARQYKDIQLEICNILEKADRKGGFLKEEWKKPLGYGLTCVLENGKIIEKAGVNYSFITGELNEIMQETLEIQNSENIHYSVTGISSIIHSSNPFVPTIHFNVRYFELNNGVSWFGGGIDLTPIYIDISEAREFHFEIKKLCDKYNQNYYKDFKKWADDYFFLSHRNETRGIGGIFFDRIKLADKKHFEQFFSFTKELALLYPALYSRIMKKKGEKRYTNKHKEWQKIRRGRYVEFNLLYDRGTKFGIETGGNTESILISLPFEVNWKYNYIPTENSEEMKTQKLLKKDIDWLNM